MLRVVPPVDDTLDERASDCRVDGVAPGTEDQRAGFDGLGLRGDDHLIGHVAMLQKAGGRARGADLEEDPA